MSNILSQKKCTKCGELKPVDMFRKCSKNKSGLYSWCKSCHNFASKKYVLENKEKRKQTTKKYRKNHHDYIYNKTRQWFLNNKDRARGYFKKWRDNNKERVLAAQNDWRKKNKDVVSSYNKRYATENPDKIRDNARKRRARIGLCSGSVTTKEIREMFAYYNYTCLCCGKSEPEIRLTHDHVIPISLGGDNTIENSQPLCRSCNSKKGIKIMDYRAMVSD